MMSPHHRPKRLPVSALPVLLGRGAGSALLAWGTGVLERVRGARAVVAVAAADEGVFFLGRPGAEGELGGFVEVPVCVCGG